MRENLFSSACATLLAFAHALSLALHLSPDLLLANGPGTCVPIVYSCVFLNFLKLTKTKIIFVESFCRVEDLSLSGKLILPFANQFIVQWPELKQKYPNTVYLGRIC